MRGEVYNILKEWIIFGKLEPEKKISVLDLAEMLGISRTPIREALLKLEDNEFITSKSNSYTKVAPINVDSATDVYNIMIALEVIAIKGATKNMNTNDEYHLKNINEEIRKAIIDRDFKLALELDTKLHEYIVIVSGNKELGKSISYIEDKILRLEYSYLKNIKTEKVYDYSNIIEYLELKKEDEAVIALEMVWKKRLELTLEQSKQIRTTLSKSRI